ncbi:hypothetical protein K450DRAFT_233910 [Umbelopsis ramanniana AG]|uniref:Uncharacterized protein n=1 Tax=Umbelopsis ramanniana AG TaxID=1314678 RepID=A0AAD5EC64_UMBRA|nr:uncharacterized protein K450DRAFT_233910 [Umbelopsis ramanniana AG]KAI8581263.1 hypothetical protein K450DRAFT_233910 [Umbelopsis ramanniana AG]
MLAKVWIVLSCFMAQVAWALQPMGYQPLSIAQLVGQADYTVLAKVVSVSPAANTTGAGPINTGSTAPTNASVATLQVLCNYIGNPPIANASTITVQGFGTYTSDCLSFVGATGWTGFFFLNHTVINAAGIQNGNTSSTDNSYQLGNHCQSPVMMSPTTISSLWQQVNDTSNVAGTGCLASNGFPLQSGGGVAQPSVAGATMSAAASGNSSMSSAASPSSSTTSAASFSSHVSSLTMVLALIVGIAML